MKRVLLLTICLLSGLHAVSARITSLLGDQYGDLPSSSASSISPSEPRANFTKKVFIFSLKNRRKSQMLQYTA